MDKHLRRIIAEQAGVVSRKQALAAGVTRRQIDGYVAAGEWVRIHPSVFRLDTAAPCATQALRAAALWAEDGVLTGVGAAWWWGAIADPPLRWEFLIVGTARRSRQSRILLQRRWVDPVDVKVFRDVRVVSQPVAVLRAAVTLERGRRGHGVRLIDRTKQTGQVTSLDLEGAYLRNRGTWGTKLMGELLVRTADRAHSDLERLGVSILEQAGITGFAVNLWLTLGNGRSVELDIAFEELKLGLEFDGFPYHSSTESQLADAQRQNDLVREGWTILRFPPDALVSGRAAFVSLVRDTLRRISVQRSTSEGDH